MLVTTDKAVQDLVLPHVRLVVNYDSPDGPKVYAHRSRHVQRSDEPKMVHSFLVPTQHGQAKMLIEILEDAKQLVIHELYKLRKTFVTNDNRTQTDGRVAGGLAAVLKISLM